MWYLCNRHQLEVVCDEVLHWDGSVDKIGRRSFYTSRKETADFIQFAFSACGYRATVNYKLRERKGRKVSHEYTVTISNRILASLVNSKEKTDIPAVKTKDSFKYCFTVPRGMLVLRRNGRINITGNSGKSSFLSQLICNSVDSGKSAFLYSGELANQQAKNWLNFIFAGQRNVKEYDFNGSVFYKIPFDVQKEINDYYRGKLYIYKDGLTHKVDAILQSMEDCARKYGCKLFILDNFTSINTGANEKDKWVKQEEFVTSLIDFAKKFNVAVLLVVHPRKLEAMRRLSKMDVQGISAIIDLAHRILSLYRVQDDDRNDKAKLKKELAKFHVLIDILKDRYTGYEGMTIGMYYDKPSRRFFTDKASLDKKYGWDKKSYTTPVPFLPHELAEENEVFGEVKGGTE
jgi:hypothetical protein